MLYMYSNTKQVAFQETTNKSTFSNNQVFCYLLSQPVTGSGSSAIIQKCSLSTVNSPKLHANVCLAPLNAASNCYQNVLMSGQVHFQLGLTKKGPFLGLGYSGLISSLSTPVQSKLDWLPLQKS